MASGRVICRWPLLSGLVALAALMQLAYADGEFAAERAAMVARLRKQGVRNERVLRAMSRVPREQFVPEEHRSRAYEDEELPLGGGHAMLSPYVVAMMAQIADVRPEARVLQVGLGSGYLAAVLGEMGAKVHAYEGRPGVRPGACERLRALGYLSSVRCEEAKACSGAPGSPKFDAIICTCAAQRVPRSLIEQLDDGGRLVIPVGWGPEQTLNCIRRTGDRIRAEVVVSVRVSPMFCQHGQQ